MDDDGRRISASKREAALNRSKTLQPSSLKLIAKNQNLQNAKKASKRKLLKFVNYARSHKRNNSADLPNTSDHIGDEDIPNQIRAPIHQRTRSRSLDSMDFADTAEKIKENELLVERAQAQVRRRPPPPKRGGQAGRPPRPPPRSRAGAGARIPRNPPPPLDVPPTPQRSRVPPSPNRRQQLARRPISRHGPRIPKRPAMPNRPPAPSAGPIQQSPPITATTPRHERDEVDLMDMLEDNGVAIRHTRSRTDASVASSVTSDSKSSFAADESCPTCNAEISSSKAKYCDQCGSPLVKSYPFEATPEDEKLKAEVKFPENLWDRYEAVVQLNKNSSRKTLFTVQRYLKDLADIEAQYGKALQKLAKTYEISERQTLSTAWDTFRDFHFTLGMMHSHNAEELVNNQVLELMSTYTNIKTLSEKLLVTKSTADKQLEQAMQAYEKAVSKSKQSQDKEKAIVQKLEITRGKGGTGVSKLIKLRDRLKVAADENKVASQAQIEAQHLVHRMTNLTNNTTTNTLKTFEQIELKRLEEIARILWTAIDRDVELFRKAASKLDDAAQSTSKINGIIDCLEYVQQKKSGIRCPYGKDADVLKGGATLSSRDELSDLIHDVKRTTVPIKRNAESSQKQDRDPSSYLVEMSKPGSLSRPQTLLMEIIEKTSCIRFTDQTLGRVNEEFSADAISGVNFVASENGTTNVTFTLSDGRIHNVKFTADHNDRMVLSNELREMNPDINFKGDDVDPHVVRFEVTKSTRIGSPTKRMIILDTNKHCIRWEGSSQGAIPVTLIRRIERPRASKRRLELEFTGEYDNISIKFEKSKAREFFIAFLWRMLHGLSVVKVEEKEEDLATPISIWVGSWNVGGASYKIKADEERGIEESERDMSEWIVGGYDMYVVGFQECSKNNRDDWVQAITRYLDNLGPHKYVLLAQRSMMEIFVFILIRKELYKKTCQVYTAQVATGIGDVIGNKGAVSISLAYEQTSMIFILSHFAARAERLEQRKANYHKITKELDLGMKDLDLLEQFDHIVWFGDLNYRVELEFNEVLGIIDRQEYHLLHNTDQLLHEINELKVFHQFQEGGLDFAPTYRMNKDDHGYSNKRNQPPSYTDRILWKSFPGSKDFTQKSNHGCLDTLGSDHRPIYCIFDMTPRIPFFEPLSQASSCYYTIKLTSVRLVSEDATTTSSICLCFWHEFCEDVVLSENVSYDFHNNCWAWMDLQMEHIRPFVSCKEHLQKTNMLITIKCTDNNQYRTFGYTSLGLHDIFGTSAVPFQSTISKDGYLLGTLDGMIHGTL